MTRSKQRFFIALLPPEEVQQVVNNIKQKFAEVYNSCAAQKSPPHITLQPPFEWEIEDLKKLEQNLTEFSQKQFSIPITLDNFGAFKPRVIFINVLKTPELLAIQKNLMTELESSLGIVVQSSKNRSFSPHVTVGFRDLNKDNFYRAWQEFKDYKIYFEFTVTRLTLLIHNGKNWVISKEFFLKYS
jgi:2'-5' RNA ligase